MSCEQVESKLALNDAVEEAAAEEAFHADMDMEAEGGPGHFHLGHEMRAGFILCKDWKSKLPDCATIEESGDSYPKTITITFGEDCVGRYGQKRNGKMVIEVSAPLTEEGATRTVRFEGVARGDHKMEGLRVIKNIGKNATGNVVFYVSGTRTITGEKGTGKHESNGQIEFIAGLDTEDCYDNAFKVTGEAIVTLPNGDTRTRKITEALVKEADCKHFVSGKIEVDGKRGTASIDFGNGDCDSKATVIRDGESREIDLDNPPKRRGPRGRGHGRGDKE